MNKLQELWDRVPNLVQSLILALVIALGDYAFSGQAISLQGAAMALVAALANFYNSKRALLLGMALGLGELAPVRVEADGSDSEEGR